MELLWATPGGGSGKATLLRHLGREHTVAAQNFPSLVTRNIPLGAYRLDQTELIRLVEVIHEQTNVPSAAVQVTWDNQTVAAEIDVILTNPRIPSIVHNLGVAVNEPFLNVGTRSIFLTLKDKEPSSLVINGYDPIWVDGKISQITGILRFSEAKAIKLIRRYGPELNGVIFLALLAFLPSIGSLWHRAQIIAVTLCYSRCCMHGGYPVIQKCFSASQSRAGDKSTALRSCSVR